MGRRGGAEGVHVELVGGEDPGCAALGPGALLEGGNHIDDAAGGLGGGEALVQGRLVLGEAQRHDAHAVYAGALPGPFQGLAQGLSIVHAGHEHNLRMGLDAGR